MEKIVSKLGLISSGLALIMLVSASAFALPAAAASTAPTTAQQKLCETRLNNINKIITRVDTRTKNQFNLFSGVATKVEAFYAKKNNNLSNYAQLVAAVNAAETQAQADLTSLQANSNISCSISPRVLIAGYRNNLTVVINDLQTLRSTVKNLIIGVAKANGSTLNYTSTSSGSGKL
ncbi:MAG: hypothetical protein ACREF7_01090 [Candidatus Saccharimonadales bacterium]